MIRRLQQGMKEDGFTVPMAKLCRWFEVPRRTVYYRPVKSAPKVQERLAAPIKQLIEADPSFGYRTVAGLLQFNKNTVQRIFQIKGWQVRKRAVGHRPRIEALPSVARTPNERWATDLCRVWAGRDGWQTVAAGHRLSHARTARLAALEKRPGDDGDVGARAGVDREVRDARTRHDAVPAEIRQRAGVHLSGLYAPRAQLWSPAGVHHAALPAAEWNDRARHPDPEGAVRTPSSLRDPATRLARHRRVDSLLQHPSAPPDPRHENPRYGVCFSGLP